MTQTHSLLQEALAIAQIGCWEWDLQSKQLTCTDEVYRLFGLDATEKGYQPFMALVHEQALPSLKKAFTQALQDQLLTRFEFCITRPDGAVHTLEAKAQARTKDQESVGSIMGTLQDITLQKEAQKELRTWERQYHLITEAVPAMIWTSDSDDKKEYVNTWMITYTGMPADKLLGDGWLDVLHPDDRQTVITKQEKALQRRNSYQLEVRFKRADGSYRWHIMHALPYQDTDGQQPKWIGINADIHEQKLKEEALQENEFLRAAQQKLEAEKEFSENILENSINGIFAFDSQARITKWNKHMEYLTGKKKEKAVGNTLNGLFPAYSGIGEGEAVRQVLEGEKITLRKHNNPFGLENRYYEINLVPLLVEGKITGGLGIIYEVTEIIRLEQAQTNLKLGQQKEILNAILRAQERERERISESLHNGLGQLLFAAKLNLQIVKTKPMQAEVWEVFSKVNELLNEAIRQSRRVSFELVPTILKDFGLQATLQDMAKTLSSPALTIEVQVEEGMKRLEKILELTIFRIIGALLSNVIEHSEATVAKVTISTGANSLIIQVADNGKGFDPSTATVHVEENSLQTVDNQLALLNGQLTIDSATGKGTRVTALLPLPKQP